MKKAYIERSDILLSKKFKKICENTCTTYYMKNVCTWIFWCTAQMTQLFFRQKEAEALRERMEREKRELQEFIGESSCSFINQSKMPFNVVFAQTRTTREWRTRLRRRMRRGRRRRRRWHSDSRRHRRYALFKGTGSRDIIKILYKHE